MTKKMREVQLHAECATPFPADVLLFHPVEQDVLIVGTYLLDEQTRLRHGKVCVCVLWRQVA
jgi:diphthamide biosynthesis protein 7